MQRVFVLDKNKKQLSPCSPARAKLLLSKKQAAVFRQFPFTIIMKNLVNFVGCCGFGGGCGSSTEGF